MTGDAAFPLSDEDYSSHLALVSPSAGRARPAAGQEPATLPDEATVDELVQQLLTSCSSADSRSGGGGAGSGGGRRGSYGAYAQAPSPADVISRLLPRFFLSPAVVGDFVRAGGLVAVRDLMGMLAHDLLLRVADTQAATLAVQLPWVLLHLAHGSVDTKLALMTTVPFATLANLLVSLASASPPRLGTSVQSVAVRNCCWALFSLVDVAWAVPSPPQSSDTNDAAAAADAAEGCPNATGGAVESADAAAAAAEGGVHDGGGSGSGSGAAKPPREVFREGSGSSHAQAGEAAVLLRLGCAVGAALLDDGRLLPVLLDTLHGRYGPDAGTFAAATLCALALLGGAQPQVAAQLQWVLLRGGGGGGGGGGGEGAAPALCRLAASLVGHDRPLAVVTGTVRLLLNQAPQEVCEQLVSEHAVGDFMAAFPSSSAPRALLAATVLAGALAHPAAHPHGLHDEEDEDFCVDVPLALVHIVVAGQHQRVAVPGWGAPLSRAESSEAAATPAAGAGAAAAPAAAAASAPVSTLVLSCRQLLVHRRLEELLLAFIYDLEEVSGPARPASPPLSQQHHQASGGGTGQAGVVWGRSGSGGRPAGGGGAFRRASSGAPEGLPPADVAAAVADALCQPPLPPQSDVLAAVAALVAYLCERDVQLSRYLQQRGTGIEEGSSCVTTGQLLTSYGEDGPGPNSASGTRAGPGGTRGGGPVSSDRLQVSAAPGLLGGVGTVPRSREVLSPGPARHGEGAGGTGREGPRSSSGVAAGTGPPSPLRMTSSSAQPSLQPRQRSMDPPSPVSPLVPPPVPPSTAFHPSPPPAPPLVALRHSESWAATPEDMPAPKSCHSASAFHHLTGSATRSPNPTTLAAASAVAGGLPAGAAAVGPSTPAGALAGGAVRGPDESPSARLLAAAAAALTLTVGPSAAAAFPPAVPPPAASAPPPRQPPSPLLSHQASHPLSLSAAPPPPPAWSRCPFQGALGPCSCCSGPAQAAAGGGGTAVPPPAAPRGGAVFAFGPHVVALDAHGYHALRNVSRLVHSWLVRVDTKAAPIQLLRSPGMTDDQNARVFLHLLTWATRAAVAHLSPTDTLLLWAAADFFQVDGLQTYCEDTLAERLAEADVLAATLECACYHTLSATRLVHLCTHSLMRNFPALLGGGGGGDSAHAGGRVDGGGLMGTTAESAPVVAVGREGDLASVVLRFRSLLMPALLAELRDRLVALVALGSGVDGEEGSDDEGEGLPVGGDHPGAVGGAGGQVQHLDGIDEGGEGDDIEGGGA